MSGAPPGGAKPVGGFSAFINKGTSGKKFAPKAARRRPGAAAASTTPARDTPPVETPVASQATSQDALPTPTATQEQQSQQGSSTEQAHSEPTVVSHEPPTESVPATTGPSESSITLRTVENNAQPEDAGSSGIGELAHRGRTEPLEQEAILPAGTRSPRTEPQQQAIGSAQVEVTEQDATEILGGSTLRRDDPLEPQAAGSTAKHVGGASNDRVTQPQAVDAVATLAATQTRRSRRSLPWIAVNRPRQGMDEAEDDEAPNEDTTTSRSSPGKRRAGAASEEPVDVQQGPITKKRRISARNMHVQPPPLNEEDDEDAFETVDGNERPARAPRTSGSTTVPTRRKPRTRKRREAPVLEADEEADPTEAEAARPRRKRKPKRKKKAGPADGAEGQGPTAEGTDEAQHVRRKGRIRDSTPSDAEDRRIEPASTVMGALAGPSYRIGKLSEREKKMREINWEEVEERRREQLATKSKDSRAALERLNAVGEQLVRAQAGGDGPQMVIGADGQILVNQVSNVIDREAEADAEIELMVIEEEDDLTRRTTTKSFMHKRKRNPQEFMYPGQGKRWNEEATEYFYEGLEMFGTDFEMIRTLFPGTPRNSIKNKFTKEERENPQRVKEALAARRNTDWNQYIARSGRQDEVFVDLEAFKREMAEKEADAERQIEAAKIAAEEEKRQMRLAGIDVDGEGATGSSKENAKGKKKKKQNTPITPREEEGVEIVEDDDPDFDI